MERIESCPVCGGDRFSHTDVLWPALVSEWEILPHEEEYINRQQGCICTECGNNLRSLALAAAILEKYNFKGVLRDFVKSDTASNINVLEINEAGGLTSILSSLPNHLLIEYPEYDMQNLPFEEDTFDLVLHSDTLEHISDPVLGLSECRRVLKSKAPCIYTVPIIVDRLSRTRENLSPSYHSENIAEDADFIVHTEFGADFWKYPLSAGFEIIKLHALEYPSALAVLAE